MKTQTGQLIPVSIRGEQTVDLRSVFWMHAPIHINYPLAPDETTMNGMKDSTLIRPRRSSDIPARVNAAWNVADQQRIRQLPPQPSTLVKWQTTDNRSKQQRE
jgi:hypothetical protein